MAALFETVDNTRVLRCSNLAEFYEFAEQTKGFRSHAKEEKSWFGTADFNEARTLARTGWDYGRAELEAAIQNIPATDPVEHGYSWDVVGEAFDMGTYLSGEPEHWLTPMFEPRRRIVRIVMNVFASGRVEASTLMNRGAAVLSLIKSLQEKGDIVNLTWISTGNDVSGDGGRNYRIHCEMSTSPFDMDSIAFIGHPSFFRRYVFAAQEVMAGQRECGGYGYPTDPEIEDNGDGTLIYMPCSSRGPNGFQNFETPQAAADWLMRTAGMLDGIENEAA
jgi:hypothetical protein